eukprot:TRINITY_DN23559_c0_g1_i1.p1 TRINITY_DN23559_c0_g1~~TRINITY_DN23559_c0_g1_i1.p1  ORF type:complete len:103 (-),score=41.15 TRINITY_DN23559_c0_g1_i1:32-340(-)
MCIRDRRIPPFLRGTGEGWVTAEYGMLPRSTGSRMQREAARGKQGGRTMEIQRLIGRSLRAAIDLKTLGERTITIAVDGDGCLLYTSPSPRDRTRSRMPSSA